MSTNTEDQGDTLPLPTGPRPDPNHLAWILSGMPKVGRLSIDIHIFDSLRAEVNALRATLPCGHPASLALRSVESPSVLCELCEARSAARDAEKMEVELRARLAEAEEERKWSCEFCETTIGTIFDYSGDDCPTPGWWVCGHCYNKLISEACTRADAAVKRLTELHLAFHEVTKDRADWREATHFRAAEGDSAGMLREIARQRDAAEKRAGEALAQLQRGSVEGVQSALRILSGTKETP